MMKQITSDSEMPVSLLKESWRGRKIYSYYKAYGLGYPFCRFYAAGEGVILLFNSTLLAVKIPEESAEELAVFIRMHAPFRVECDEPVRREVSALLPEYEALHRTTFELQPGEDSTAQTEPFVEFNPTLEDVYHILEEGFPNLQDYPLWLTDTSHRCRHGISHVLMYKNSTTASIMFDIEGKVLVGQVATLPQARGLGHARVFLRWLAGFLAQFGKTAVLYALDIRESFYREIGFRAVETEYVLERRQQDGKGRLDNGHE